MAAEFHTEGLQFVLEAAFSEAQAVPVNFYIGLATDASLAENAALADLTELSGNGYARQAVPSSAVGFVSAGTGTNDRQVTTAAVMFTASGGNWATAYTAFLTTVVSGTAGKLIGSGPINSGAGRQIDDGEAFEVELVLTLTG